jgi:hypothetical protein
MAKNLPKLRHVCRVISRPSKEMCPMTDVEYARKLAELDRLLNDPEVPMRPAEVWELLAEISAQEQAATAQAAS